MLRAGSVEAANRGFDRAIDGQSASNVQYGRVPHFDVTNTLARGVFGELEGNPLEGRRRLHDRKSHLEALQVILEVSGVVDVHVRGKGGRAVTGHRDAIFAAEVDQRLRTNGSVEMTVQFGLRQAAKDIAVDGAVRRRPTRCSSVHSGCVGE